MARSTLQTLALLFLLTIVGLYGCKDEEGQEEEIPTETLDRSHLVFGGPFVLRRDQGDNQPLAQFLWLCGVPPDGAGNADASDWTNADGTWDYDRKPRVEGNVEWDGEIDITLDGNGNRVITGNGLPDHPTGIFPIDPASVAYQYDRNPNVISPWNVLYVFPAIPEVLAQPRCVTYGPSGISLTGSAIYHGASTLGNDAAAHEILDRFGGHTDGTETYHYHYLADDLQDHVHPHSAGHSGLLGYMLDGFGIYGPYGENGELLWSKDLDECHGHTHPIEWDGEVINLYHYHWTYDFPYTIGCFKGEPN